jgi:hypothetical protein
MTRRPPSIIVEAMQFLRTFVVAVIPGTLALGLIACGGKAAPAQPTLSSAECGAAAQNTARLLAASLPDTAPTLIDEVGAALERRCREDRWTEDAQACIATAAEPQAMEACDPLLTQAQRDAAGKELGDVVMTAMGGTSYGAATSNGAPAD